MTHNLFRSFTLQEKYARLILHLLPGIGPKTFLEILSVYKSAEVYLKKLTRQLLVPGVTRAKILCLRKYAEQFTAQSFVVYGEKFYPKLLAEIPDPPIALFLIGNKSLLQAEKLVSVVGTRAITAYGKMLCAKFIGELIDRGYCVVSGLAFGVDALVHECVLQAKGKTIAVLAGAVSEVSPRGNWQIYEKIKQEGLIISEFPPGKNIAKGNFPRRNRIIAGISPATIVVEAPVQSGALITARQAFNYHREVYAVPGNINLLNSQGCNNLIKENIAQLLSDISQIEQDLHLQMPAKSVTNETDLVRKLSTRQRQVLDLLAISPKDFADLQYNLQFNAKILADEILALELLGKIVRDENGSYGLQ